MIWLISQPYICLYFIFGGFSPSFPSLKHWPLSRHLSSVTLTVCAKRSMVLGKWQHTARDQNVPGFWAKKGQPTAGDRDIALLATNSNHPLWSANEKVCLWWLCCLIQSWCQIIKDFFFLLNLLSLDVISFFKKIILYVYNRMYLNYFAFKRLFT